MSDNTTNYLASLQSNIYKKKLCKESGCCGAASDAWVPSYPSVPINNNNQYMILLYYIDSSLFYL